MYGTCLCAKFGEELVPKRGVQAFFSDLDDFQVKPEYMDFDQSLT